MSDEERSSHTRLDEAIGRAAARIPRRFNRLPVSWIDSTAIAAPSASCLCRPWSIVGRPRA
jgi:hypothetical protein